MKCILKTKKDGSEGESVGLKRTSRVLSFSTTLKMILIPCVKDYQAGKLCNQLWYNIDDYKSFYNDALDDIQAFINDYNSKHFYSHHNSDDSGYEFNGQIITGRMDVIKAKEILYQPNFMSANAPQTILYTNTCTNSNHNIDSSNDDSDSPAEVMDSDHILLPSPCKLKRVGESKIIFEECEVLKHPKTHRNINHNMISSSTKRYAKQQQERQLSRDEDEDDYYMLDISNEEIDIYDNCVVLLEDSDTCSPHTDEPADSPRCSQFATDVEYHLCPSGGYMMGEYMDHHHAAAAVATEGGGRNGLSDTLMEQATGSQERIPRLPALGGFQLHDMFMESFEGSRHPQKQSTPSRMRTSSSLSSEEGETIGSSSTVLKVPLPFLKEASLIRLQKGGEAGKKGKDRKKESTMSTLLAVCSTFALIAFKLTET